MASEDVIELGSSDDDAEPEPKKAKTVPNVMVHIPQKLPSLTIKPARNKTSPVLEKLATKAITVTKIKNPNINPFAQKNKPILKCDPKKFTAPIRISNPLQNLPRVKNPQFLVNTIPVMSHSKQSLRFQGPNIINNLPPNITVKRSPLIKINPAKKPRKLLPKKVVPEVQTVELDDDECAPSTNISPQWYLRPEEQTEKTNLEQENNKEPEKSKIIEITIEDSPVKPLHDKRAYEIGAQLAITIEDSPIKPPLEKNNSVSGSDNEDNVTEKEPDSRKKLEYPKMCDTDKSKTIEIELEPIVLDLQNKDVKDSDKQEIEVSFPDDVVIQENSTILSKEGLVKESSKNVEPETVIKLDSVDLVEVKDEEEKEEKEFHPVYQSFIELCFNLENSEDMKKIVEKKVKAYYRQVPKIYTESEAFIDMVSSKISSMKAGPEKMYLYIKDVVDELNLQRKIAKSQVATEAAANSASVEDSNKFLYGEDSEFDKKRQRQIRKLEKTLKKLHRAIQLLEEQEVDFDDEDDSVYLLTERYKERMVRVHAKFCQLTNTKMPSEPRVQIDARPGQPAGPAKRLEKWINRKVPIGSPLPFPDFHDVLRCVREANEEDKLGWNEADIIEEARDLFTRCGRKLQRRRQENEWRLAASRISLDEDPAEKDVDLKRKLALNSNVAAKKEIEVFNKYADRQYLLKLEAEEIGDKEADESPIESEDEENNDEGLALLSQEKRKERLKRLLQEKSKKNMEKQDEPTVEDGTKDADNVVASTSNIKDDKKETTSDNKENKTGNEDKSLETTNDNDIDLSQDKIHSLSDDSNLINSDIDELHLLAKLHDKEVLSSTLESSDSDTPIAISDTLSSDDNRKQASDVISIENSSYSESETGTAVHGVVDKTTDDAIHTDNNKDDAPAKAEKSIHCTNNNEYNESVEDILLASSDEENVSNNKCMDEEMCINLDNDSDFLESPIVESDQTHNVDGNKKEKTLTKASVNLQKDPIAESVSQAVENDQVIIKNDCNLNKDLSPVVAAVCEGDKRLTECDINSKEDSVSIVPVVTRAEEQVTNEDVSLEKDLVSNVGPIAETKHLSDNGDLNTAIDASCVADTLIADDQAVTKDINVVLDSTSNEETVNNVRELIKEQTDIKSVEVSASENKKLDEDTNELGTDVVMTDVSRNDVNKNDKIKEIDPLVDKMEIGTQPNSKNDSDITVQADIYNGSGAINIKVTKKINETESQIENCS